MANKTKLPPFFEQTSDLSPLYPLEGFGGGAPSEPRKPKKKTKKKKESGLPSGEEVPFQGIAGGGSSGSSGGGAGTSSGTSGGAGASASASASSGDDDDHEGEDPYGDWPGDDDTPPPNDYEPIDTSGEGPMNPGGARPLREKRPSKDRPGRPPGGGGAG